MLIIAMIVIVVTVEVVNKHIMKKIKYTYVIDITNCYTEIEVIMAIIEAKVNAGVAITPTELDTVISYTTECSVNFCKKLDEAIQTAGDIANNIAEKITNKVIERNKSKNKPHLLKRFWNWMTRKK